MLVRAGLAALAVAAVVSILWYLGPEWKFYLSLALGFGVAESIAHIARGKRGVDLQILAIAIVTLAIVAVRVLLAWKYGLGLDQLTSDEPVLVSEGGRLMVGIPREMVQLMIIPDVLFMALSYAIVWIRFR